MPSPRVFISYSHKDETARDQLLRFLRPLERSGDIVWWADTRIDSGLAWRPEIGAALATATAAVLLISQDFLDSNFIVHEEIPPLLAKAIEGGMLLLPVFLSPCSVQDIEFSAPGSERRFLLSDFQGYGTPEKTLREMRPVEREKEYVRLTRRLKELAGPKPREKSSPDLADHPAPADSRRTSVQVVTPPARELPESISLQKVLSRLLMAGGAGAGLCMVLGILGFLSLRARESLLSIDALAYPRSELLATGADTLLSLPRWGLAALLSTHPVIRWSSFSLLALALLAVAVVRRPRVKAAELLALLLASAGLLALGSGFYMIALGVDPIGAPEKCRRLDTPAAQAAFETCSWLENDSPTNDARRRALGGLLGWLLLACLLVLWTGGRARELGKRLSVLRWGLVGWHALIGLLLLQHLPRAYAVGKWGLSYPMVSLRQGKPECEQGVARAIESGGCCAFDVSAGAFDKVLLLQGDDCPGARSVTLTDGCVDKLSKKGVILHACR